MNRTYLFLFGLLLSAGLKGQVALGGLFTPVYLNSDTTEIILKDYLADQEISAVFLPEGLSNHSPKKGVLQLSGTPEAKITKLRIHSGKNKFSLILIRSAAQKVNFRYSRKDLGKDKTVRLIGTFNNWNRASAPLKYVKRKYQTTLSLEPGRYAYKLFVDGQEMLDPKVAEKASNGMGSYNNILNVVGDSIKPGAYTIAQDGSNIVVQQNEPLGKVMALWQNQAILGGQKFSQNGISVFKIPEEAKSLKRSYLRVYQYLGENKGRDQLIPLEYGQVVREAALLDRSDWHKASMYFIMVDRFANGDAANDEPVQDTSIHPKANYQGGDLAGIQAKIHSGYFKNLGVNTIWVSPISQNPRDAWGYWDKGEVKSTFSGYHGYWPVSNTRIDYRFGSPDLFRTLLDSAHNQGFNVVLDYVANHVHINHPIYQKNKDWATPLYLPDGTKNTENWDSHRLTTWFDDHLPTLDLRRPEIVDPMVDSALYWLQNYELDGFRHDATKHIDELYWRTLTSRIRSLNRARPTYQIGETYGSPGLINGYISTGMLDAQFDFNLYDAAVNTFAKSENVAHLKDVLESGLATYGYHHLMGNISGNQDRARFISYASGDVKFEEDAKLAGWDRRIPNGNAEGYKRLALLQAFNYAVPGIPCIYYGDEIGLPGGNDPDNRRMMKFENRNSKEQLLFKQVAELNHIRSTEMPLLFGSTACFVQGDLLYIRRDYFEQSIVFVFNLSRQSQELIMPFEIDIKRNLDQVRSGQISDGMERVGPAPIKGLSYQIFANY